MKEIIIKDKQKYLDENYVFGPAMKLSDIKECIYCEQKINVGDYKFYIYRFIL